MTTVVMPGRRVRRFDVVGLRVYGRDDLPGSRARLDHRVSRTGFGSARWPLDEVVPSGCVGADSPVHGEVGGVRTSMRGIDGGGAYVRVRRGCSAAPGEILQTLRSPPEPDKNRQPRQQ